MMMRSWLPTLLSAVTLAAPIHATAQSPLQDHVNALVEREVAAGRFSGVVLVAQQGERIAAVAGGSAHAERNLPVTLDTRFNLASGDKLFTKIAILQLVQAGRLALTDTVGTFLRDYANATVRSRVTVQQLLQHRSGLGSFWGDAFRRERTRLRDLADIVRLFEHDAPAFEPGSRMAYSNNGYVLLGRIVENVTGESYFDYVRRRIFEPARMTRTAYLTIEEWPDDKAVGYTSADSLAATMSTAADASVAMRTPNHWSLAWRGSSAGGGYSTAGDLLALDVALRRGALVDTALLARFTAAAPDGRRILANGGGPGANFEFVRTGAHTLIVLSNYDPAAATRMQQQVMALLAGFSPFEQRTLDLLTALQGHALQCDADSPEHRVRHTRLYGL